MSAKMSGKLWRLGAKNALVVGLAFVLICAVLAGVISFFTPRHWFSSLDLAVNLLFAAVILAAFASSAWGKVKAGSLRLDAGAHPTRRLSLIIALIFFVIGINDAVESVLSPSSSGILSSAFTPYVYFASAASCLYLSFGRLQIRENGIWVYWGLHPWDKIASYTWTEDATLIIRTSGWLSFWQGGFVVPPEHKAAFERYLLERTGS